MVENLMSKRCMKKYKNKIKLDKIMIFEKVIGDFF